MKVDQRTAEIQTLIESFAQSGAFSGAIWVAEAGETIYAAGHGYADWDQRRPFTLQTTADTGSYTKSVVATTLFRLQEEGRLSIDDPVAKFVVDFPYPSVRIVDLLGHSSGIPDHNYFESLPDLEIEWTNPFFLDALRSYRPDLEFPPGERVQYSTLGYDLLASVIEGATGGTFFDALSERYFKPLQMDEVFLRPRYFSDWPHPRTRGYRRDEEVWTLHDSEDNEQIYGGANLFFSTEDLHLWNSAALSKSLLSPSSLAMASPRYELPSGTVSSLNLLCEYVAEDQTKYWFTGDWKGFYTMVFRDHSSKRSIVYITNSTLPMWLRAELVLRIESVLDGDSADTSVPDRVPLQDFADLFSAGKFQFETLGEVTLRSEEGWSLTLGSESFTLYPVSEHTLYLPEKGAWISISQADGSDPIRLHWIRAAGREMGVWKRPPT